MIERPNPEKVLRGLKDFQRVTVERAFERMYGPDPTLRFLVADEVGLGKTLVARGLVAKVIDHLWDSRDRVDVVYVCSSTEIASQNIRRLNVLDVDPPRPTRITLLPSQLRDLVNQPVNLVPLTPNTSFKISSSQGLEQERALLWHLLCRAWPASMKGKGPKNVLQGWSGSPNGLAYWIDKFDQEPRFRIDPGLARGFSRALGTYVADQKARREQPNLRSEFEDLSDILRRRKPGGLSAEMNGRVSALVGTLRQVLARACVDALEPDLVILDEFQRFKDLLVDDPTSEPALLARTLFESRDPQTGEPPRVLLLSATPYKMYTLSHEREVDDHYADFLETAGFLMGNDAGKAALDHDLGKYREALLDLARTGDGKPLSQARDRVQSHLRSVMVRTERLAVTADRAGMLTEHPFRPALAPRDAASYVGMRAVSDLLDEPDPLEYWKSSPYPLNFMDEYKLKKSFASAINAKSTNRALAACLGETEGMLLASKRIERYDEVDPGNDRLRHLYDALLGDDQWRLLWIPPALPYYELEGAYAGMEDRDITKRLIFSSWRVVPRALSSLLSYEAERRLLAPLRASGRRPTNKPEASWRRTQLLRFSYSKGRPTGLPLFTLLYPSTVLAEAGDPLEIARSSPDERLTLAELRARIRERLSPRVRELTLGAPGVGQVDERWYWAAPFLLDHQVAAPRVEEDLSRWGLLASAGRDDGGESSGYLRHVEEIAAVVRGDKEPLGRVPPDLLELLVDVAASSPAVCAMRAFLRLTNHKNPPDGARVAAVQVGLAFRRLFLEPEVQVALGADVAPYWRRVLTYCAEGGLQATLDEYVHFANEFLALDGTDPEGDWRELAENIRLAIDLRAPSLSIDDVRLQDGEVELGTIRMRSRFAMRFAKEKDEFGREVTREDQLRQVFNSPFWPFVLVTTSVGQEGLDFHGYCHAVEHWNLPSNPVDLEQREGRVHRYKGHAIRKNVARRYGQLALSGTSKDPWRAMFAAAVRERPKGSSDLIPYWVFPGSSTIERHVPMHALSRDERRYEDLRRSLAVYRMVFGQPRQDELLAYLQERLTPQQIQVAMDAGRVDLAPRLDRRKTAFDPP